MVVRMEWKEGKRYLGTLALHKSNYAVHNSAVSGGFRRNHRMNSTHQIHADSIGAYKILYISSTSTKGILLTTMPLATEHLNLALSHHSNISLK